MISSGFRFLESYKDQIGLLIQALLLVATIILIRVGLKQAKAADAQAKAADQQVKAAESQVTVANAQALTAQRQLYASLSSSEAATRPLLKITSPSFDQFIDTREKTIEFTITNCGLGPALDLTSHYGNDESDAAGLDGEFLGIGDSKIEEFEQHRVLHEDLTILYSSTQGSRYKTCISYDVQTGWYFQFHKLVKNAFQDFKIEDKPNLLQSNNAS